ncbi:MAG: hypothetical protein ABR991_06585, partial [Terracidiphilus sp.]
SSVIDGLMKRISQRGRMVKMRHLKPRTALLQRGDAGVTVVDPHGKPPRSALLSLAKIFVWLLEEWRAHLFQDKKGELLICDRYYHDLLIDPRRYRYGGSMIAARLVGKLMPPPDLWVFLDAPALVLQARKQEVPIEETERQRHAYLEFVKSQKDYRIVDASQALSQVIADAEAAITGVMKGVDGKRG